jgi:hypothetical protein
MINAVFIQCNHDLLIKYLLLVSVCPNEMQDQYGISRQLKRFNNLRANNREFSLTGEAEKWDGQ